MAPWLTRFFVVREYEGEIENRIFRDLQWSARKELPSYDFLEAGTLHS